MSRDHSQHRKNLHQLITRCGKRHSRDPAPHDLGPMLVFATLEENATSTRANRGLAKISSHFVDFNDLRVSPPSEIEQTLGVSYPEAERRADRIIETLNRVFNRHHALDLEFVWKMGKRDLRIYFERLHASPYVISRMLQMAHVHVIPVDSLVQTACVKLGLADPDAKKQTVRGFLERHVPAGSGPAVFAHLRQHANWLAAKTPYEQLEPMEWESEEAKRKRRRRQWAIASLTPSPSNAGPTTGSSGRLIKPKAAKAKTTKPPAGE